MDLGISLTLRHEFYLCQCKIEKTKQYQKSPIQAIGLSGLHENVNFDHFLCVLFKPIKKAGAKHFSNVSPQLLTLNQNNKR